MKHSHAFSGLALSAAFFLSAASCVQISDPSAGASEPTTHSTNFATGAEAISGSLDLVVSTEATADADYGSKNIVPLWVEDSTGAFVKTLGVWAATRKKYLTSWISSQENSVVDGIAGATRANHDNPLVVAWDGTFTDDTTKMKKDTYLLRGEITDHNGAGETFSVSIDLSAGSVDPPAETTTPGFTSIDAAFTVSP